MKRIYIILLVLINAFFVCSCEKNIVEYDEVKIDEKTTAEFQIFYLSPVVANAANNINKIELNDKLLINSTTPLNTYNMVPGGAVSRFFTTQPGKVNLKLYTGPVSNMTLSYNMDFDIPAGRYNLVIHDFAKPPILVSNDLPYPTITTELTGTTAWVKFSNFMYESVGVPTNLKLQYQYQYTVDNETSEKSNWLNLGKAISFGESTGWEPVPVNKTVIISAGTARIDYRIRLIGTDGSDQGPLMVRNTSGTMVPYSDWWNVAIGRIYHHNLAGFRSATPIASVRSFGVL